MASKIKSKPPKQSEMTPDLPSDDLQLLSENNPPENNPGNRPALETSGENSSSHKTGGPKPGPSKKSLHGRRKRYMHSVSKTIYNIEQKINHFLKLQHEQRQEIYQEHSHQFLNLVVMWNIDADEVKKHGENLFNMFNEQRKFIHQTLTLQKNRMEEIKSVCEQYLEGHSPNLELTCHVARLAVHQVPGVACPTPVVIVQDKLLHLQKKRKLETLRDSRGDSVVEELRHLIATLEIKLLMLNRQQESAAADQSLLDLLFS